MSIFQSYVVIKSFGNGKNNYSSDLMASCLFNIFKCLINYLNGAALACAVAPQITLIKKRKRNDVHVQKSKAEDELQ
jgi:hypothetical protein